jgi:hypothetical protein
MAILFAHVKNHNDREVNVSTQWQAELRHGHRVVVGTVPEVGSETGAGDWAG